MIPGLIDAHTHIPMTLFRGLADDLPLHTWLEQHVWPAEHRFINSETVRWASRLGVAELLRSGVTTLCDMYFYEDEVAAVVDELGMRGVLANAHFDVTNATNTERERSLAEAEQFVARWRGHSRIVPAGARALKLDHLVGSLEAGKRADVVIIDLDEDNVVPLYDPVSHLAYAVEAADVRTVIVDGRIVLRDGVLTTADEQEIRRQVRALAMGIGSFRANS